MDQEQAVKNLKTVKRVFDDFGIMFWLDGGTLLGAVRDCKLIDWDHDMDLCVWKNDRKKLLLALKELRRRKGQLKFPYPLSPNIESVTISLFPFDCVIDIQLWSVKNNALTLSLEGQYKKINLIQRFLCLIQGYFSILRHYLFCDFSLSLKDKPANSFARILELTLPYLPKKLKNFLLSILLNWKLGYSKWILTIPKHYFEKFGTIKFYGSTFNIPLNVEDYLKYHYGENWRIPQKKWDWLEDDRITPVKVSKDKANR